MRTNEIVRNRHWEHYNPKNDLASMPDEYIKHFKNGGTTEFCDMLQGPCACGASHHQGEWPDKIQLEVFGNISKKESSFPKRKPLKPLV